MPTAFITGITGQDGAYLAKFLLELGYEVWGTVRAESPRTGITREIAPPCDANALRVLGIAEKVRWIAIDYLEINSLARAIELAAPDEVYNLAAQSSVARSFEAPTETGEVTALSVARLLHALREVKPDARFFQASSSEMFGKSRETPQSETTPFYPRSPYGAAKVYAHWMTVNYREAYNLHASCGILFNHESPLRPERFVTRKITQSVARIACGQQKILELGNLEVQRDWGFAGDYVQAMHRMLQESEPDDYILATGRTHSLRQWVQLAFEHVGLDYEKYVRIDPKFLRPAEVETVTGNPQKARERLNWQPQMSFEQLIAFLVDADLRRVCGQENEVRYLV
jgi:GDPmannose 4,6-dehydratase